MHGYLADIRVESRVKVFRASLRVAVIGMVQWLPCGWEAEDLRKLTRS